MINECILKLITLIFFGLTLNLYGQDISGKWVLEKVENHDQFDQERWLSWFNHYTKRFPDLDSTELTLKTNHYCMTTPELIERIGHYIRFENKSDNEYNCWYNTGCNSCGTTLLINQDTINWIEPPVCTEVYCTTSDGRDISFDIQDHAIEKSFIYSINSYQLILINAVDGMKYFYKKKYKSPFINR